MFVPGLATHIIANDIIKFLKTLNVYVREKENLSKLTKFFQTISSP